MKNALALLLILSIALAVPAHAQSSAPTPPPLTTRHYDEDYLYLRDPAARTGAWWEPLKYDPLNATGDVYLTLGAELRLRYEHFENNNWGQGPATNDGYLWYRALPLADLHLGPNLRLFGQLIAGWAADKEDKGPVDETGVDLLQGFADLKLPLSDDNASLTLRPGRQMLAYGSERLIGLRYGPNIPRTFDGAKSFLEAGDWRVDGFYARPVAPRLGNFDDRTDDTQSVWSLYATRRNLPVGQGTGLDVYYIGFDNDAAVFNQGAGAERRQTLGARFFGQAQGWDWNWEVFYQFGTFGDGTIRAWSVASDTGYTFANLPLSPRLGLKANIISGDDNPADPDLQTFNPLFPKGKYFGELSLLGPQNLINLHPTVDLQLAERWKLGTAGVLYWRESTGDGIYDVGGNLLRGDGGSNARFIGTQAEVVLTYEHSRNVDALLSYSLFLPGKFIDDTGPSKTVHFIGAELRFWF
jgi:hypothetical protein